MAEKRNTIFHNISNVLFGQSIAPEMQKLPPTGGITSTNTNRVLYSTNSKEDYERKLTQYKQQKLLSYQWAKAGADNAMESLAGYTAVKLMYRDSDLMDEMPEIGAALDLISEEACAFNADGEMVHVKSKSKRIKSILEDLFYERLNINVMLPMIARSMVKYGNEFMLLNIDGDRKNGVLGWKELPVYEMDRIENGYTSAAGVMPNQVNDLKPDKTVFVWVGRNESLPYQNWQVAHFRLLKNSLFLPYGCIVGDTRIETENGYKEIDSISIGDRIWTFDVDKQEKVLATVSMGMFKGIKDVYSVKTIHNFIEGTSDHKLLCYEDNQLKYKEIKDIKVGDLLVIDNGNNKCNISVKIDKSPLTEMEANLKKSIQWWTNYIDFIPDYVDEDFANFLGFMIGDGWLDGNRVCFATGEYDCFNKKYANYLEKISNKKVCLRKNKHKINYSYSQALVTSKCLATILRRMGFVGNFNEKRIPEWLYSCNDKIKKAFLDGLMTADGSYNIDKFNILRCSIELSNEQLIKDVKTLVQSLGFKSGQISSRNRCNVFRKPLSNGITIKGKTTSYYFYYFESENKQEKNYDIINRKNDGFKTEKVISNEYIGKKKTYDITVDNNNSNFFANGIVTHNCSHLHKARRAWRMWSMMEDGMLIYRLDKSIERRVFKVFVGAIDDQDVPAFIQEFANNFKRTPIIDPATGQVDLRKNFLDVSSDYFIPVRDPSAPTPIETLQSAQNPTAMDDIKYMQNKVFAALRVPKAFLNYEQAQGKGQNMSLLDIRFARMVNSMQQFLLLELNKIAMIHLFFMGLSDEITNFTLSMNNPSAQIEALELEDITKRIQTATAAVTDPGTGIPLMSIHKAMKKILKMSDAEIKDMFLEIRLEKAMAAELEQTAMIIKKTGIFDSVDRIYGDFNAMNGQQIQQQQQQDGMGGGAPGGASGGFEGGSLNMDSLGGAGTEDMPDMGGEESSVDMSQAPDLDNGGPMESKVSKPTLNEKKKERIKSFTERYFEKLNDGIKEDPDYVEEVIDFEGKNVTINEKVNRIFDKINNIIVENEYNGQDSLDDTGLTESAFDKDFYNEIENEEE